MVLYTITLKLIEIYHEREAWDSYIQTYLSDRGARKPISRPTHDASDHTISQRKINSKTDFFGLELVRIFWNSCSEPIYWKIRLLKCAKTRAHLEPKTANLSFIWSPLIGCTKQNILLRKTGNNRICLVMNKNFRIFVRVWNQNPS